MSDLEQAITQTLEEFKGGVLFFDHLDKRLAEKKYVQYLLDEYRIKESNKGIIVSGRFGDFFWNTFNSSFENIILINGSLNTNQQIEIVKKKGDIYGTVFWFIDDSFYSGRTLRRIENYIEHFNSKIGETFVLYDGSTTEQKHIHSLFRYHKL